MVRIRREDEDQRGVTGIALSAALGLGIGVLGGMVLRELLSGVSTEPVRNALNRLRQPEADLEPEDVAAVEHAVEDALDEDPEAALLEVKVTALGDGIVELTGTVPDALDRQLAGDIARGVPGADIVVNRILVQGSDSVASE
ncbi:MAG: BON domain-containing protein, partial [Gemmatimonadota bacterium]